MNLILFDDLHRDQLLPLAFTRPIADLRIGILKISEKWERKLELKYSYLSQKYLSDKFPTHFEEDNILIAGGLIPDDEISREILSLKSNDALIKEGRLLAVRLNKAKAQNFDLSLTENFSAREYEKEIRIIDYTWDFFIHNGEQIEADFKIITKNRQSRKLSKSNNILGDNIFVEEGVKAEFATINTDRGPVYLGENSEIMEGAVIRGPFALGEGATLKMMAKIYGPTTVGPHSKVGGEVNNSIIQSNSNKGHEGFLGNSVIGEWCNIGADSNNSNLKNNYAEVRMWSYPENRFIKTGLQFCGLIMGDHSKCGINTMFNTGTVVGVNANIYGSGFIRNFLPSFSVGGPHGLKTFSLSTAFEVARTVFNRRGLEFDTVEENILKEVSKLTEKYRNY